MEKELSVIIISALPITELRAAIPLALKVYHFGLAKSLLLSILGNMIPAVLLIYLLEPVSAWLSKHWRFAKRFFDWLFAHTRDKFTKKYLLYGEVALVVFVAIPLPGFGVWTGAAAAWLLGIKPLKSLGLIFLGVCLSAIIVVLITTGVSEVITLLR